jgi:uncharacterized phiE125 gp8 family phage protein
MEGNLKLITAPIVEPVTAAEVKLHAHISHSVENMLIESWIASARKTAEDFQRRAYVYQEWELSFDKFPTMPILLPRPPLIWVKSIKYYDYLNAATTIYETFDDPVTTTEEPGTLPSTNSLFYIDTDSEPGRVGLAYGCQWPSVTLRDMNAVKIRYIAGCGDSADDVPDLVKDAIMLFCTHKNENRASEDDAIPKQFFDLLRPERVFF